ncbi:MAG: hypothetical protein AB7D57_11065 [Desulfovibrionaceae bacterium]
MRYVKLAALVILLAVAGLFFMQNDAVLTAPLELDLDLYFVQFLGHAVPTYAIFIGAFLVGWVLSLIFLVLDKIQSARQLKACRRKLASLEQEVTSLRNLPLSEQGFGQSGLGGSGVADTAGTSTLGGVDKPADAD